MTTLEEIRAVFLDYFKKNSHEIFKSSSLIPENDETLLFTNAGMVQFKDFFTGKKTPEFQKITTAQKCIRAGGKHNDLENVGYTSRHHTFFEMLGNFSFGDYFKEEAIYHAWQVITKEFGISPKNLLVTVFHEDEEAFSIWKKVANLNDDRIIRISSNDNFWSMGDTGPCGPCSEIFFDHGEKIPGGIPGSKEQDGDRFTEIWNLVFMQYEQKFDGSRVNLPNKSIDTGMGLERIAAVLQNKHSNFEIDIFKELKNAFKIQENIKEDNDKSLNVIIDHIRAISFLIADGVMPLNEGRGYVLRRIIRRAVRHTRILGCYEPCLFKLVDKLVGLMGKQYFELEKNKDLIKNVLLDEEQRFGTTLDIGLRLVEDSITDISNNMLSGAVAFKLYDTYGFPVDLTADILKPKGITVDLEGFQKCMLEQKNLSRKADLGIKKSADDVISGTELEKLRPTEKLCYEKNPVIEAKIIFEKEIGDGNVLVILDRTPFFAESGGQVGDTGFIKNQEAVLFEVNNTKQIASGPNKIWIVHECTKVSKYSGGLDFVTCEIDPKRRKKISAHHSATHILQAAMRKILGNHITQKGSFVSHDKLRFDFTNNKEISCEEKRKIEDLVNEIILSATPTEVLECSKEEAFKTGALAFFDEKYSDNVRVVQIGKEKCGLKSHEDDFFSREFCGGSHVENTGEIGCLKIIKEFGIASGIRRIEAVCGLPLLEYYEKVESELGEVIDSLQNEKKVLQRELKKIKSCLSEKDTEITKKKCGLYEIEFQKTKGLGAEEMRGLVNDKTKKCESDILILIGEDDDKVSLVVSIVGETTNSLNANSILQIACKEIEGKGGGKGSLAQGSGRGKNLDKAIDAVCDYVKFFK